MDTLVADRIKTRAEELETYVVETRRRFHMFPELSGKEYETANAICKELDELGVPYRRVWETGIIATIKGEAPDAYDAEGNPRHRIALRSDIDALPVTERTGEDFASQNEGVMHACGHDCHIAMMLTTIKMLVGMKDLIRGEVRIIFQPAEEISVGALHMIKEGALEGVDTIYGAHIWSEVDAGTISCEPGHRMGNTDWFRVDIKGVSAHGSMPHKGVDAIVVGAELVNALQILVSRDISPFQPVVVTIGEFHGGEARNIMAGSAYLTGTVRTWSDDIRSEMPSYMRRIVGKVANAFNAEAHLTYEAGNGGLSNDEACAERARKAVVSMLGEEGVAHYQGTMSGEDFSEYLKEVPGVFVFVGCRNPGCGAIHPQHSCFYTIDESVLIKGAMVATRYTIDYLSE